VRADRLAWLGALCGCCALATPVVPGAASDPLAGGGVGAATASATAAMAEAPEPVDVAELAELADWTARFAREVDHRLALPIADQQHYIALLQQALANAQLTALPAQAFVLVDRSAQVQAAMLIVRSRAATWHWLGAVAVSTGSVGRFEHFRTPLGVFAHTLENPDFRAEGTFNQNHIRGYGLRGRRVFDFGWQLAERGWGAGGSSQMRLQMHATDPQLLEQRLGRVDSEGCVRIPATLNVFLDAHGVIDADYEQALAHGQSLWVIKQPRQLLPWPGRYLVVVDSQAEQRPAWSPPPGAAAPKPVATKPRHAASAGGSTAP